MSLSGVSAASIWTTISTGLANGYMIGVDTGASSIYNIPAAHAFSVVGAYQLKDINGNVAYTLYRVRSPWGYDSYTGPWSDGSSQWTAAYQKQVPYVNNANDGTFYIASNDFLNAFTSYEIGYVHAGWNHSYYSKTSDTGVQGVYTFTTTAAQEIYIMGDLYDFRQYPTGCKYSYTSGNLAIYQGATSLASTTFSD